MKVIIIIMLFAVASLSAQVKTNVTTTSKSFLEVTTVKVDSVDLERFIKSYIDRNSVTSNYTLAQIDAGIAKANSAGSIVTFGTLTASGIYTNTGSSGVVNSRQLYYKNLLINGATAIRVLTSEIP